MKYTDPAEGKKKGKKIREDFPIEKMAQIPGNELRADPARLILDQGKIRVQQQLPLRRCPCRKFRNL